MYCRSFNPPNVCQITKARSVLFPYNWILKLAVFVTSLHVLSMGSTSFLISHTLPAHQYPLPACWARHARPVFGQLRRSLHAVVACCCYFSRSVHLRGFCWYRDTLAASPTLFMKLCIRHASEFSLRAWDCLLFFMIWFVVIYRGGL